LTVAGAAVSSVATCYWQRPDIATASEYNRRIDTFFQPPAGHSFGVAPAIDRDRGPLRVRAPTVIGVGKKSAEEQEDKQ